MASQGSDVLYEAYGYGTRSTTATAVIENMLKGWQAKNPEKKIVSHSVALAEWRLNSGVAYVSIIHEPAS